MMILTTIDKTRVVIRRNNIHHVSPRLRIMLRQTKTLLYNRQRMVNPMRLVKVMITRQDVSLNIPPQLNINFHLLFFSTAKL